MSRQTDFVTLASQHAKAIWESTQALKAMQAEWNAQDYGTTMPANAAAETSDGPPATVPVVFAGTNASFTRAEVGAVVFDTANAIIALFVDGHATNLTNLL